MIEAILRPLARMDGVEITVESLEGDLKKISFGAPGDAELLANIILSSGGAELFFSNGVSAEFDLLNSDSSIAEIELQELIRTLLNLYESGSVAEQWILFGAVIGESLTVLNSGQPDQRTWYKGWHLGKRRAMKRCPAWKDIVAR